MPDHNAAEGTERQADAPATQTSEPAKAAVQLLGAPPADPDALHTLIQTTLGVTISRTCSVNGHSAPFDYICHTFFEGAAAWPPPARNECMPDDPPRDCIVWANRGGGKTYLGALATALDMVFKPGIQIRILAGSLDQGHNMHEHLRTIFAAPEFADLLEGRITDRRIRLKNKSVVVVLAQSQASVRGTRVQKLRCDEVDIFDERIWEAAQLTTRSAVCDGIYIRGTVECLSTMHNPHGLMFNLVRDAREGKRRLFKWGLLDVMETCDERYSCHGRKSDLPGAPPPRPCALLPECQGSAKPEELNGKRKGPEGHIEIGDALRQKSRVPLSVWESEMLCLRTSRTNSVLPEFDVRVHVVSKGPEKGEIVQWLGGMDFGFRAPTVVLWAALDHAARLWIMDERIVRHELVSQHIAAIKAAIWPPLKWVGIDPAGHQRSDQSGESNAALLRRAGLHPRSRQFGIQRGLVAIRARLQPADNTGPRLFIHQRCKGLIEAMQRYRYDASRPDSDQPLKDGPDHAVDALRYLIGNLDLTGTARVDEY